MYVRLSLPTPQVDEYKVCSSAPLGPLLLVRLEKQRYWVEDNWFCRYVTVEPPGGGTALTFPCYRWLIGDVKVEIREGTGNTALESDCVFFLPFSDKGYVLG